MSPIWRHTIRSLFAVIPSLTPRFPHVVPSLKIWERVEQGNQTQRTKTRTIEPREPKNRENHKNHENQKNQRTTRTREPENQKNYRKKHVTRRRFYVTKLNKRNVTSAVAIILEISRISATINVLKKLMFFTYIWSFCSCELNVLGWLLLLYN